MKKTLLFALALAGASAFAQESDTTFTAIRSNKPAFISSSATITFEVESISDVKHIIYAGPVKPKERYSYIDSGVILGKDYNYYINNDDTFVVGVPKLFPNVVYVISIYNYEPQGGWASQSYVDFMRQLCNCE